VNASSRRGERETASRGIILGPGEGRTIPGTDAMTLKATGEDTGGSIGFLEATSAPGTGPPRHIHHSCDELFYVLEGEFLFLVRGAACQRATRDVRLHPARDGPRGQGYWNRAWQGAGGLHTGGFGAVLRGVRPVAYRAGRRPHRTTTAAKARTRPSTHL
jgi:mannose-6-phosphate isomerase-like protein (cupin superfamily)